MRIFLLPLVLLLFACSGKKNQGSSDSSAVQALPIGLQVGQMAPDISLPDVSGKIIPLSSFRGKYVLLDFWASWCGPCRQENPNVVNMYAKYNEKGFTVYSVSLDNSKPNWIEAIAKDNLKWNHVSDLKMWNSVVVTLYQIDGIPLTFLLDKNGKIIGKNLRGPELEKKLKEIFGEK